MYVTICLLPKIFPSGDDGTTQEVQKNVLMKESDHVYSLWCTGRPGCNGALFQLRLKKRQDFITMLTCLFKPQHDKLVRSKKLINKK